MDELHRALAAAMDTATGERDNRQALRDRFLRNGPIPSSPEVLVEEMTWCQQFLGEDGDAGEAPRSRYRTCLLRLELLAVDHARWKPKLAILRRTLEADRDRERRSNIVIAVAVVSVLAVLTTLLVYLIRLVASFWT
jgi:hypothetical protein